MRVRDRREYMARYNRLPSTRAKQRVYDQTDQRKQQNRTNKLRSKYNLTIAEWDAMFLSQGKVCAVCSSTSPGGRFGGRWQTDHNHKTDKTRGILCVKCNRGIGLLNDDPLLLRAAVTYLEKHK